ncbi:hypothetical protein GCM10010421_18080 [Streptomyces glaucus]|uniref:Secreted protein n=1 Tax=Streptomyces glaucus TaxID=284029 RepID=A0ABN3JH53_9ACTN
MEAPLLFDMANNVRMTDQTIGRGPGGVNGSGAAGSGRSARRRGPVGAAGGHRPPVGGGARVPSPSGGPGRIRRSAAASRGRPGP